MAGVTAVAACEVLAYSAVRVVTGQTHELPVAREWEIIRQLEAWDSACLVQVARHRNFVAERAEIFPVGFEVIFEIRRMRVMAPWAVS